MTSEWRHVSSISGKNKGFIPCTPNRDSDSEHCGAAPDWWWSGTCSSSEQRETCCTQYPVTPRERDQTPYPGTPPGMSAVSGVHSREGVGKLINHDGIRMTPFTLPSTGFGQYVKLKCSMKILQIILCAYQVWISHAAPAKRGGVGRELNAVASAVEGVFHLLVPNLMDHSLLHCDSSLHTLFLFIHFFQRVFILFKLYYIYKI